MRLIAKKPCSFEGEKFFIGDVIPAEYVLNPAAQEKMGVLSIVGEGGEAIAAPAVKKETISAIELEVKGEHLSVSKEGLQAFISVLTETADDAVDIVKEMTDGDALILVHSVDDRKTVRVAAETRAKSLLAEEGEQ